MLRSTSFVFDGIPSENYGIMIYFLDDSESRELSFGTDVEVIEDRLSKRIDPIHYGVNTNKMMSFPLTFGSLEYLSDYDVDAILSWLTGHNQYKWLEYVDGDQYVRYRCHLNNVRSVYINGLPVAFTCDVECDGQFAYEHTHTYTYDVSDVETFVDFFNKSSYNGYLYPTLHFELSDDCNGLSIINDSDDGREFKIDYFDRSIIESGISEIEYNTTLASALSDEDLNFLTWQTANSGINGNYGEIIAGKNVWVMLPLNGDIALYSENKGASWNETTLPYSGSWSGCYGDSGFVGICTDINSAISIFSEDGIDWGLSVYSLPVEQTWNKVSYVETSGMSSHQYIAVGGPDSNIAAVSSSGYGWVEVQLPTSQNWQSVFGGKTSQINTSPKIFAVGGDTNLAAWSEDGMSWYLLELPKTGNWTDGCYGDCGFIMICNNIINSASNDGFAIVSSTGSPGSWNVIDMPLGPWQNIEYSSVGYIATGGVQYVNSFDLTDWDSHVLPNNATNLSINDEYLLCATGTNSYLISNALSSASGEFTYVITSNTNTTFSNIRVYASIEENIDDNTYISLGEKILMAQNTSDANDFNGDFVAVASNVQDESLSDNVSIAAVCDEVTGSEYGTIDYVFTIKYIIDFNSTEIQNAQLKLRFEYEENNQVDLGYDDLTIDIDNKNQIITTNKDTLNVYEYFNMKFLRLKKGMNKLRLCTLGGVCKVVMKCDFLRKVGG